jgi:hypothetical protein
MSQVRHIAPTHAIPSQRVSDRAKADHVATVAIGRLRLTDIVVTTGKRIGCASRVGQESRSVRCMAMFDVLAFRGLGYTASVGIPWTWTPCESAFEESHRAFDLLALNCDCIPSKYRLYSMLDMKLLFLLITATYRQILPSGGSPLCPISSALARFTYTR